MEYVLHVTILILIDGFLQFEFDMNGEQIVISHNPYFNRWFSAINKHDLDVFIYEWSQSLF